MNIRVLLIMLSFTCCWCVSKGQYVKRTDKPNVILIMTDDMGYGDLGYHGNSDISTPVLDKLANESVAFNNFYVSPVCAPTRASLMTGRCI